MREGAQALLDEGAIDGAIDGAAEMDRDELEVDVGAMKEPSSPVIEMFRLREQEDRVGAGELVEARVEELVEPRLAEPLAIRWHKMTTKYASLHPAERVLGEPLLEGRATVPACLKGRASYVDGERALLVSASK